MNSKELHQKAMVIFDEVCDLAIEEQRRILDERCSGNPELRARLNAMLHEDGSANSIVSAAESGRMVAEIMHAEHQPDTDHKVPENIGPYKIVRTIGEGGMGIIYEAQQEAPKRRVALKVLKPGLLDHKMLKRFQHESHVLGQLHHPGIAHIHESGLADLPGGRLPYFAMEFVDGEPLDKYADAHGLDVRQRLELLARVCNAVHHAHQKGVIHRDLKPSNVLVISSAAELSLTDVGVRAGLEGTKAGTGDTYTMDAIGQPKVLDFGIARVTDADLQTVTVQTEIGQLVGTLAYMSPEQVTGRSEDIDTRCDVYALGVMLYELLTGQRPYDLSGLAIAEASRIISEQEPASVGMIDRTLRGDVETIIAKSMEKDRDRRYVSAAEFAADIRRFLDDRPIEARPASTFYQLGKFARRNRGLVAGVAMAFIVLVLGLATTGYLLNRTTIERDRARNAEQVANEARATAEQAQEDTDAVARFQGEILKHARIEKIGQAIADHLREASESLAAPDGTITLETLFQNVNPTDLARRVLKETILTDAAESADVVFSDRPLLRARLHESLAETFDALGLKEEAFEQISITYDLRLEELGPGHAATMRALGSKGMALVLLRRFPEAEANLKELVRQRSESGEPQGPYLSDAHRRLGSLLLRMQNFDEAEKHLRLSVDGFRALNVKDEAYIESLSTIGRLYLNTNRLEKSRLAYDEAYRVTCELFGPDDHRALRSQNNLATVAHRMGRTDEAETQLLELLPRAEKLFGSDDHRTLIVLGRLVGLAMDRRDMVTANERATELLERSKREFGSDHPQTRKAEELLAEIVANSESAPTAQQQTDNP